MKRMYMDGSAIHLSCKLKRNEKPVLAKGENMENPFFNDIDKLHKMIFEKCKNGLVNERVYPFISDNEDDRDINYRPFSDAIELTNKTVLSDKDNASYIIQNLNTEWALSAIEQLCHIYNEVTLYRLYTHTPYKYKVIAFCKERTSNETKPLTDMVLNKENLEDIHAFLNILSRWTLSMIWVAETEDNTFVSSNALKCYFEIMERLLDNL